MSIWSKWKWREQENNAAEAQTASHPDNTPRYCAGNVVSVPAGAEYQVAYLPGARQAHLIPIHIMEMLSRCQALKTMEEHARACQRPSGWATDLHEIQDQLYAAITREDYVIPFDLASGRTPDEARQLTKTLIGKFGQLVSWWPAMIEAAARMRQQERRLAVAI